MFLQTGGEKGRKDRTLNCLSSTSVKCLLQPYSSEAQKSDTSYSKECFSGYHSGNQILLSLPFENLNRRQRCQMKQVEGEYITEVIVACVSW